MMVMYCCSNVSRSPGQAASVTKPLKVPSSISPVNFLTQRQRFVMACLRVYVNVCLCKHIHRSVFIISLLEIFFSLRILSIEIKTIVYLT